VKLPPFQKAVVTKKKVVSYLLSSTHPDGRSKAKWFTDQGFEIKKWERLAQALKFHAKSFGIEAIEETPFGIRYTIVGPLETPVGERRSIRAVWFVDKGRSIPRLVTAYPIRRRTR
jgi:hypothetical protein